MSRINVGIMPFNLTDQHLMAEFQTMKRISNLIKKWGSKELDYKEIPDEFTFGPGHLKFFLDKSNFILQRYLEIYIELKRRNFSINDYYDDWSVFMEEMETYRPTAKDIFLVKNRIKTRIIKSSQTPKYYKEKITKYKAISMLNI